MDEMFRLTKFIDSKSSIEASIKNARFKHRQFNQSSIQPATLGKKKPSSTLMKLLGHKKSEISRDPHISSAGDTPTINVTVSGCKERPGSVDMKLSNDDYIYATYQLTRDRMLRAGKGGPKINQKVDKDHDTGKISEKNSGPVIHEEGSQRVPNQPDRQEKVQDDKVSTKENEKCRTAQQRKYLQPQHKMRDKFTSFFRSGSSSPNGSLNYSCDSSNSGDGLQKDQVHSLDNHHEAFNDHNNEHSNTSGSRYYVNRSDNQASSLAYALPLARKCSLVSEESGCSAEIADT